MYGNANHFLTHYLRDLLSLSLPCLGSHSTHLVLPFLLISETVIFCLLLSLGNLRSPLEKQLLTSSCTPWRLPPCSGLRSLLVKFRFLQKQNWKQSNDSPAHGFREGGVFQNSQPGLLEGSCGWTLPESPSVAWPAQPSPASSLGLYCHLYCSHQLFLLPRGWDLN